jgi:hypothetical protein
LKTIQYIGAAIFNISGDHARQTLADVGQFLKRFPVAAHDHAGERPVEVSCAVGAIAIGADAVRVRILCFQQVRDMFENVGDLPIGRNSGFTFFHIRSPIWACNLLVAHSLTNHADHANHDCEWLCRSLDKNSTLR